MALDAPVHRSPRPDIPIYLAGLSPAMLRLAGEVADGVLLWACPASYLADVVIPEVTRGRQRAGKDLTGFAIMPAVPSAAGGERGVVLDGVRRELHRYFGLPFYRAMFTAAGCGTSRPTMAALDPEAQRGAISEEFIENLCALGSDDDVRAGIKRFREAGAVEPGHHRNLGHRLHRDDARGRGDVKVWAGHRPSSTSLRWR